VSGWLFLAAGTYLAIAGTVSVYIFHITKRSGAGRQVESLLALVQDSKKYHTGKALFLASL
jgi:hypothetical protein